MSEHRDRRNKKYSSRSQQKETADRSIQPKILLKKEPTKEKDSSKDLTAPSTLSQISIATREQKPNSGNIILGAVSANSTTSSDVVQTKEVPIQIIQQAPLPPAEEPAPEMSRPITILTYASSQINPNAAKVLIKNNTDFLVVGTVGMQGVGKSTILNLLSMDLENFDEFYINLFETYDGVVFPIKMKASKGPSLPRTESIHMFINYKDRLILLDTPPLLCNSNKKDATTNEIDDLRNIILLLTVCHLILVVQDDYFNLNFIRLLQFAEITKTHQQQDAKFSSNYFPNVLFVKNRGKRIDFLKETKEKYANLLKMFFKDSKLKVYFGQSDEKSKIIDSDRMINQFVFPEVKDKKMHSELDLIIKDFRNLVYMTPRNQIYNGPNDLTEALWFELLTLTAMNKNDFIKIYEDIKRYRMHSSEPQI